MQCLVNGCLLSLRIAPHVPAKADKQQRQRPDAHGKYDVAASGDGQCKTVTSEAGVKRQRCSARGASLPASPISSKARTQPIHESASRYGRTQTTCAQETSKAMQMISCLTSNARDCRVWARSLERARAAAAGPGRGASCTTRSACSRKRTRPAQDLAAEWDAHAPLQPSWRSRGRNSRGLVAAWLAIGFDDIATVPPPLVSLIKFEPPLRESVRFLHNPGPKASTSLLGNPGVPPQPQQRQSRHSYNIRVEVSSAARVAGPLWCASPANEERVVWRHREAYGGLASDRAS